MNLSERAQLFLCMVVTAALCLLVFVGYETHRLRVQLGDVTSVPRAIRAEMGVVSSAGRELSRVCEDIEDRLTDASARLLQTRQILRAINDLQIDLQAQMNRLEGYCVPSEGENK